MICIMSIRGCYEVLQSLVKTIKVGGVISLRHYAVWKQSRIDEQQDLTDLSHCYEYEMMQKGVGQTGNSMQSLK